MWDFFHILKMKMKLVLYNFNRISTIKALFEKKILLYNYFFKRTIFLIFNR